jgi:cytoskeletal protein RodZ
MLGSKLKQARESRELPLREIEWATRISADYLAAIEAEEFDRLPGAVYARGFIRSYATYLGLDPEPLIAEFNANVSNANQIVSTRAPVREPRTKFALTPAKLAAVALLLIAGGFGYYIYGQLQRYYASQAAEPAVSPSPVPSFGVAPTPQPQSPNPSPSARVYTGVEVTIKVDTPTWLRVDVDGKPADQTTAGGRVFDANTVLTFTATQSVHVRSGKAVHTFITVNGKDRGAMPATDAGGVGDQTYQKGQ